ncbi:MAG: phenylalanine--tRNA ligase subunit beta, partial [Thermoplasmataceae archaeon]
MVVIKGSREKIVALYGREFLEEMKDFSRIIGFTVEEGEDEVRVEFNPDRPDLFAFSQLKQAVDVFYHGKKRDLVFSSKPSFKIIQERETVPIRRYILGFSAKGNRIGDHMDELIDFQEKLHQTVGKNRMKVSIGLHDSKNISNNITFRAYRQDEIAFTTYDGLVSGTAKKILEEHPTGKLYSNLVQASDTVAILEDSNGNVLSMPPIINGVFTKITPETSEFFVDITGNELAATRNAFYLLLYYFGNLGYVLSPSLPDRGVLSRLGDFDGRTISVNNMQLLKHLGMPIKAEMCVDLLSRMGFEARRYKNGVICKVPGNRVDVMGPIDIIEDIAKSFGYDNIPPRKPDLSIIGESGRDISITDKARHILLGMSIQEIMSYVVGSSIAYSIEKDHEVYKIMNPKSEEFSVIRNYLYPNLLEFLRINKKSSLPQEIFEVGYVVNRGNQRLAASVVTCGTDSDYSRAKGILDSFSQRFFGERLIVTPENRPSFIDGRSGCINRNGACVGIIGEIHPETLQKFDITAPVSVMEIFLDSIS